MSLITKQFEQILKDLVSEPIDEQYREIIIEMKDEITERSFIVDLAHFKWEIDNEWLYVRWNGQSEKGEDPVFFSHLIKLSEIAFITDEV